MSCSRRRLPFQTLKESVGLNRPEDLTRNEIITGLSMFVGGLAITGGGIVDWFLQAQNEETSTIGMTGPMLIGMGITVMLISMAIFLVIKQHVSWGHKAVTGVALFWMGGLVTAHFTGNMANGEDLVFNGESWAVFYSFAAGFAAFLLSYAIWFGLSMIPGLSGLGQDVDNGRCAKGSIMGVSFVMLATTGTFASIAMNQPETDLIWEHAKLATGIAGVCTVTVLLGLLTFTCVKLSIGRKFAFVNGIGMAIILAGSLGGYVLSEEAGIVGGSEWTSESWGCYGCAIAFTASMFLLFLFRYLGSWEDSTADIVVFFVSGIIMASGAVLLTMEFENSWMNMIDTGIISVGLTLALCYFAWRMLDKVGKDMAWKIPVTLMIGVLVTGSSVMVSFYVEGEDASQWAAFFPIAITWLVWVLVIAVGLKTIQTKGTVALVAFVVSSMALAGTLSYGIYLDSITEDLTNGVVDLSPHYFSAIISGWVLLFVLISTLIMGKKGDGNGTPWIRIGLGLVFCGMGSWATLLLTGFFSSTGTLFGGIIGGVIGFMILCGVGYSLYKRSNCGGN